MRSFLIACLIGLVSSSVSLGADPPVATGAAALVNGTAIPESEYRFELKRVLRQRQKNEIDLEPTGLAMLRKEVLESLIGRELLCQEARRKGIRAGGPAVEEEIGRLRSRMPGQEDFAASLAKLGLTEQSFKAQIERGMTIQALIDSEFGSKTAVSEAELKSYYDSHRGSFLQPVQVRLSHILIAYDSKSGDAGRIEGRAKIEAIRKKISKGEDFAVLARESDDRISSTKGGDLGYFTPGQLGKEIEKAAFSLGVGQVSAVVEDRFGFHLLKVSERRPEAVLPLESVRDRVSRQLQRVKTLGLVNPYLKRVREAAKVEILLDGSGG